MYLANKENFPHNQNLSHFLAKSKEVGEVTLRRQVGKEKSAWEKGKCGTGNQGTVKEEIRELWRRK